MNALLQSLVRGIGLMASLGLFLLALVVTAYAFIEGGSVVAEILQFSDPEYSVIYNAMKVVDLFLCESGVESEDQHCSSEPTEHMHDQALVRTHL
ncbi:hypothetical protein [Salinibacter ruber]|uniref:hypothetical protein n=1 Tax=Salinibacter ruber TaxID=146919 RepID=UPI00216750ED|nr:hypothetical protein [Salinibacter ruber]MCS4057116.1 hypothetical protein [Salinibacter ruber]